MNKLKAKLEALRDECNARRPTSKIHDSLKAGCWIYGAGGYGQRVFKALHNSGYDCFGFIDKRCSDPVFAGKLPRPALHPDGFDAQLASGRTLVVGIMNTVDTFLLPQAWARLRPFADTLLPGHLPEVLGAGLGNYWMTDRAHAANHIDDIVDVASMMVDKTSAEIIEAIARFRISGDVDQHPEVDISHQYLPPGVPLETKDMVLVDGGAYVGDTYELLTKLGADIRQWYAFEPDLENFKKLAGVVKTTRTSAAFFPCGLGDRVAEFSFSEGAGAGSHVAINAPAASVIRVLPLDSTIPGAKPTYIKLDVEGFEAEALHGMRDILDEAQPALAVCIYHKPDDLWELPRLVRNLMPNAKLYVRQHGHNGFDTVLYAIP